MKRLRFVSCLWPGLHQLWHHGSWSAMLLAGGFTLLLNLLLASTFVWTELVPPRLRSAGWLAAACVWSLAAVSSYLLCRRDPAQSPAALARPDLFPRALTEYLRRNWLQAENLLRELLGRDKSDVVARLLLVAVYRQAGRRDAALRELALLERFEASIRWRREIAVERGRLEDTRPDVTAPGIPASGEERSSGLPPGPENPGKAARLEGDDVVDCPRTAA